MPESTPAAVPNANPPGSRPPGTNPPDANPAVAAVLLEHARRGVRLQLMLRAVLVAFVVLTLLLVPPDHDRTACYVAVLGYAGWAGVVTGWVRFGGAAAVRLAWVTLFVDVAVLGALTLLTGLASQQSWTADVLVNGLVLIPVLAAGQLRTGVCTAIVIPTVLVYLAASIATKNANAEPWESIALRTLVTAGLGAGCVGLSRIQRSRVLTIAALVRDRTALLADLMNIEERERGELAETLHDGALQYILGARHDLEDARASADTDAFERIGQALTLSSRLLRSTVAELHPAVLAQAGLAHALADLARSMQTRGGFELDVDAGGWPETLRTTADSLIYGAARELLGNVVKHARAARVEVRLAYTGGVARLVVADDGCGTGPDALTRAGQGHIGLASQRARIEAAGGRFSLAPAHPNGTVIHVEVPTG